ncbi:MAG TPA: ElyC/SanA/YdcF family protein [Vitreimonas sp.]|nr:ElyC/SanA/YdcF family protein [Vitreimonas sp.]
MNPYLYLDHLLLRVSKAFWQLSLLKKIIIMFSLGSASIVILLSSLWLINWWVHTSTISLITTPSQVDAPYQTALVLGAKVYSDGGLSHMTQDRADTAIELYRTSKVKTILISGDHGQKTYDEVNTIKNYLLAQDIPPEVIFLDHAGFDTYDSLYRAREVFQVESVIIVTQAFHLPRALFIAQNLGINAVGVSADRREYAGASRNEVRERLATLKAAFNVLTAAPPQYLGEPIPLSGNSRKSWD